MEEIEIVLVVFCAERCGRRTEVAQEILVHFKCVLLNDLVNFRWIKEEYNNPEILITENGWSDEGEMNDVGRIEYLRDHLNQILDVVLNDNCNLIGYIGMSM